jgi:hypothetical protein
MPMGQRVRATRIRVALTLLGLALLAITMFGLSIEHLLILLVALFILGPQRLPNAAEWLGQAVRRVRGFAATAQEQMRAEPGAGIRRVA